MRDVDAQRQLQLQEDEERARVAFAFAGAGGGRQQGDSRDRRAFSIEHYISATRVGPGWKRSSRMENGFEAPLVSSDNLHPALSSLSFMFSYEAPKHPPSLLSLSLCECQSFSPVYVEPSPGYPRHTLLDRHLSSSLSADMTMTLSASLWFLILFPSCVASFHRHAGGAAATRAGADAGGGDKHGHHSGDRGGATADQQEPLQGAVFHDRGG